MTALTDRYGRTHRDLRISLTDRCSLRCTYCMPADGVPWLARDQVLSRDEIVRVARVALSLGIKSIRLTGGEPLVRPDVVDIVAALRDLDGPDGPPELSLTTNGLKLPELAAPLRQAGLTRVNVSLDTLRADRYLSLTRRDRLHDAVAGLQAARAAGLSPIKVNAVAMQGINDDEVVDLTAFAIDHGYQMRFIEQMPLDAGHTWQRARMVTAEDILSALRERYALTPAPERGSAPADVWLVDGGPASVGVIASVTRPFCGACDRVRLTADGQLRVCLFAHQETDLRALLRASTDDAPLADAIALAVKLKRPGHDIDHPSFLQPERPMSAIGG